MLPTDQLIDMMIAEEVCRLLATDPKDKIQRGLYENGLRLLREEKMKLMKEFLLEGMAEV